MAVQEQKIQAIEKLCVQDTGRNITPLSEYARGGLLKAAQSIADHPQPHIAILTGFFIPGADPPAAETDGIIGTVHLASGLLNIGIPVRIATDDYCLPAVLQAVKSVDLEEEIDIDSVPVGRKSFDRIQSIEKQWQVSSPPVSHIISIERVGPGDDHICRNMRGEDISEFSPPLYVLFANNENRTTIGIGDGGNELGMGQIPPSIIEKSIQNGKRIRCCISCDHLIVSGVSNWGAMGLLAALAILMPNRSTRLIERLTPQTDYRILKSMVDNGVVVDGINGKPGMSVDNVPWEYHSDMIRKIIGIVDQMSF